MAIVLFLVGTIVGSTIGLFAALLFRQSKCRSCAWREQFGELEPLPDPVVHRVFLERVYDALADLPSWHHEVPEYDCPARRSAALHNEIAAILGRKAPYQL